MTNTASKITAQVAVESVNDCPEAFDEDTRRAVLEAATDAGVHEVFLSRLRDIVNAEN